LKKSTLVKIFLRSLFIQVTLNFRRMQNLGFAMAIIPVIKEWNLPQTDAEGLLTRHLQMFNTHPYFSASIIGSVLRLEEEQLQEGILSADTVVIKQSLMGPYAAIGDTFFWGALRPFAAIVACILAYRGYVIAPLVFLLLYTPAHVRVRLKGFFEGYRQGKNGIEFIRIIDLLRVAVRIRWLSLILLAGSALWFTFKGGCLPLINSSDIVIKLVSLAIILICLLLIKIRISQFYILYGAAIMFLLISLR
jgi:mannose PTS system EIID component